MSKNKSLGNILKISFRKGKTLQLHTVLQEVCFKQIYDMSLVTKETPTTEKAVNFQRRRMLIIISNPQS